MVYDHIRFTPLQVMMLLHYYTIAEPYSVHNPAHANSEAVTEQRASLIHWGYLKVDNSWDSGYRVTQAGLNYVRRICAMA